jgi:putative salt-induced outer membrane protein YdiY
MHRAIVVASILCLCLTSLTLADEIQFINGDRLTGKIKSAADGKMVISTDVAGDVTVDMSKVKTFTTTEPLEIHIGEKNVIKTTVGAGQQPGTVQAAPAGGAPGGAVAIKDIKSINPPPVKWTGAITANGLITRGNSNTEIIGLRIDAERRAETDRITFNAAYLYGRQKDPDSNVKSTTTDNWFIFGKYDYFFSKKFYGFVSSRFERDRIAELDLRFTPAGGVGYQWIERTDMHFFTEGGLAWVYEDFENADSADHFALRLAYHFDKKINDKVNFYHNMEYLPSIEHLSDFNINTDAGVRVTMLKNMFTELKLEWKFDNEPAPGAAHNDLRYILGVGWAF